MTASAGHGLHPSRFAVLVLLLAALAAAFSLTILSPAHAQERERIGLLNRWFGSREVQRVEPAPPARAVPAKPRPRKKRPARAPVEGTEAPQAATVTKNPDARVILVVGDFLAGGLAEGLATAFSENPDVRIIDRSNGSSGLVRQDFYDWPAKIDELIGEDKPAAIIVMIGANDRQEMVVDEVRESVRSENWNKGYAERADKLAKVISNRKIPFLWVGAPPFKSSNMMQDMLAFNEKYRAAATATGGEFVDIWDGFVDEKGAYISNGPDLNGQPARLRANDGINFARPGKRKIAFYAERPLHKILGTDPSSLAGAALAQARPAYRMFGPFGPSEFQERADLDIVVDPDEVGPIDPARPVALRTPGLDGGEELLGLVAEVRRDAVTPAEKLIIEGIASAPPAGRADQASWPQLASAASAMRRMNLDKTLNKASTPSVPQKPAEDRAAPRSVRSDVLANPEPPMPPRPAPEVHEDRLEEISSMQPAPDVAAAEPPMSTPATVDKASVPDFAKGDPRDLSPARDGAPLRSFKRPTSIGPEPNRAPTAVPRPAEDDMEPAEATPEIPVAAAVEEAAEPDTKPALPDTAPQRAPAPSTLPEIADDRHAPARGAPEKAEPVPVAALPDARDVPFELPLVPVAPLNAAPNTPVALDIDTATAKPVSALKVSVMPPDAPDRSAPASEVVGSVDAPSRLVPSALSAPVLAPKDAATPAIRPPLHQADTALARPWTRIAPAPLTLPISRPAGTGQPPAITVPDAARAPSGAPAVATPPAPAAPTVLPGNALTPSPAPSLHRRAALPDGTPLDQLDLPTRPDISG